MKKHNEKMTMEQLMADYKFNEQEFDFDVIGECEVSDMEKQKILKSALEKAGVVKSEQTENTEPKAEKFARRRLPLRKAWALGLVAVMVFAMGGIAVAKVAMDDNFLSFLQPASEEQAANLNAVGSDVTQEVTDNGLTVRARQMVGDGHHLFLLFDVIAPEGMVLDPEFEFFNQAFCMVEGSDGAGYSFERIDDNPNDNKMSCVLSLDASNDVIGHNLNIEFNNLERYNQETEEFDTLLEGSWKLKVPCNYVDQSEKHKVGKTITYRNAELNIEDIVVSPFTAYINVSGEVVRIVDERMDNVDSGRIPDDSFMGLDDYENLKIKLKDGSVVNMRGAGSSGGHGEMTINYEFERMIELDNIQSISFAGNEIYHAE